jgi:hypothetical protein
MKNKFQSGMQGVFLVAAELTRLGFIVSLTSRNAFGADLLITDQKCERSWSVQVKTNSQKMSFWLLSAHAEHIKSTTHIYVLVTLKGKERPDFHVIPSEFVATHVYKQTTKSGTWYSFDQSDLPASENWEVFGNPSPEPQTPSSTD